jgi:2'-5' RNA ligase
MSKIRAFIAIELPEYVRLGLFQGGQALSHRLSSKRAVRWVPSENLHLTLRFLGDSDSEQIEAAEKGLDDIARKSANFDLHLGKLGCFPNRRKPRVIWVDLGGDLTALTMLQQETEEMLSNLGWQSESRRFHAHVTLGRVKESHQVLNANFPWELALDPLQIRVSHISLISSDLRPSGAVYTVRHRSRLIVFP